MRTRRSEDNVRNQCVTRATNSSRWQRHRSHRTRTPTLSGSNHFPSRSRWRCHRLLNSTPSASTKTTLKMSNGGSKGILLCCLRPTAFRMIYGLLLQRPTGSSPLRKRITWASVLRSNRLSLCAASLPCLSNSSIVVVELIVSRVLNFTGWKLTP